MLHFNLSTLSFISVHILQFLFINIITDITYVISQFKLAKFGEQFGIFFTFIYWK